MRLFFLLLLLSCFVFARELHKVYFVTSDDINLSVITGDKKNDMLLYTMQRDRYLMRVRSKDLLAILHKNGYRDFTRHVSYVIFIKQPSIDMSLLEDKLKNAYKEFYGAITIKDIKIIPREKLKSIPQSFSFKIQHQSFLRSHGTFSIKTPQAKQYFFDYYIDAEVSVYKAKKKILKDEPLSGRNITKRVIQLDRFRAKPIQNYIGMQAKHRIKEGKIITQKDITKLSLVRRGEYVSVVLEQNGLEIGFSAKALQAGSINDIILIQNKRGKKMRVKVIGKNLVQVVEINR
jgi:flagella basal body P-ring formation protein FlgA